MAKGVQNLGVYSSALDSRRQDRIPGVVLPNFEFPTNAASMLLPVLLPHIIAELRPLIGQITSDTIRRQLPRAMGTKGQGVSGGGNPSRKRR